MYDVNPFSLSFGKEPISNISRTAQYGEVLENFMAPNPGYQVCMITGVRGSGKTVALTSIANTIREDKDWIVVDLNPERDLLNSLAAELSSRQELVQMFKDAKINLSLFGLGLEIDGTAPVTDVVVVLQRMLEKLTQKGKKVLITIDEVVVSKTIKEFSSQFQIFMRKNYSVFLLMTGLYENIYELQNEKTLTFLYRAPKLELKPLNIRMVAEKYSKIFGLSEEESLDMAKITKGYPFAFQVLGYLCYKNKTPYIENIAELDNYLDEYVYEKIWSELSEKDKSVVKAISQCEEKKNERIRKIVNMDSNAFSVYRNRMIKKGIVTSSSYGYLEFTLPRFEEFVKIYV